MRSKITMLALIGTMLGASQAEQLISIDEVSREDIHRGEALPPPTGPTEPLIGQAGEYYYSTWYHAFGVLRYNYYEEETGEWRSEEITQPLWEMCPDCGSSEAGYELKIYSKQDPTKEKLDKPIVIVPGFDPDYGGPDAETFYSYKDMLTYTVDENNQSMVIPGQNLLKELYDANYDIAIIKFYNPNIDIPTNAKVLKQALLWLNSKSSTSNLAEPAIVGASMGGLIARYMLQEAGKTQGPAGGPVKSRLFISFDAPNRGAEIPMSVQACVKYLEGQDADAKIKNSNIASVSAGQMLLSQRQNRPDRDADHYISDYESPSSPHGAFMNDLNSPTNRAAIRNIKSAINSTPIRLVAIASGSNQGANATLGYTPGLKYGWEHYAELDYDLRFSKANTYTEVFFGDAANTNEWNYWFSEPTFIENAPGGKRSSYSQLKRSLSNAGYGPHTSHWPDIYKDHCFIPTASALGFTGININTDAGWLTTSSTTMFDEAYAPTQNQNHVAITPQNKGWILSAINRYGPRANAVMPTTLRPLLLP